MSEEEKVSKEFINDLAFIGKHIKEGGAQEPGVFSSAQDEVRFLQVLIDAIPIPIFYKGVTGVYLGCNRAYEKMVGVLKEKIIGKTVYDMSPKYFADKYNERDQELFHKGGLQSHEAVVIFSDGKQHDVVFYKEAFLDVNGKVAGLVGIVFDISERKQIEGRLKESHAELELRVKVRTAEFTKMNEELRAEIAQRRRAEDALRESEEWYRLLFESNPLPIWVYDLETHVFLAVNDSAVEHYGFTREEFLTMTIEDIRPSHEDSDRGGIEKDSVVLKRKVDIRRHRIKDGTNIFVELISHTLIFSGRRAEMVIAHDITELRSVKEALEFTQFSVDNAAEAVFWAGHDGRFYYVNSQACSLLGYSREQLLERSVFDVDIQINKENWPTHRNEFREAGSRSRETELRSSIGKNLPVDITVKYLKLGEHEYYCALVRDISERRKIERQRFVLNKELVTVNARLKKLALTDQHTGLYNHRYLEEAIEAEFHRAKRFAYPLEVIMLDIDYFKSINELYGHQFGDLVLKQFARELKKLVRRYDIVVRSGGEEFIIVSPGIDRPHALALGQRLLDALSLYSFGNKAHVVKLKLSISLVSYPEDSVASGMDMLNLAERILDKVKEKGGNQVYSALDLEMAVSKRKVGKGKSNVRFLETRINRLTRKAKQSLVESIFAFAKAIELKDHYTGAHVEQTVYYAIRIAKELGLDKEEIEFIREAAILHDLGKIGISENILLKKAKLSAKEYEEIKKHPQIGADIIRPIQFLRRLVPYIFYHHERWDGRGYPSGLKKEEIPLGARIIALADVYQALTSDRPYHKAYSQKKALEIIRKGSGSQFDPKIVAAFFKILQKKL